MGEEGWPAISGPLTKFLKEREQASLKETFHPAPGEVLLFISESSKIVNEVLARLRLKLAKQLNLIPENKFSFVWITDFPLLEYDEVEGRFTAKHHPFTSPLEEDLPLLNEAPEKVRAKAYDWYLTGRR